MSAASPTLSVVCITRDPGLQVVAALAPLRAVAHEIVVAADHRVPTHQLAHYATVADRVIRYPFELPVERPYAWAHAQCTGDWILRIDGDEWLSPELVARLPELIARRDRVQYWIPRRWSFPDAAHWIEERPWAPDVQLRLVRNDPATLGFPGIMHSAAYLAEPNEVVEQPMYHLDLVLQPLDVRRAKAETYEALRPGMTPPGGGPMEMYYVPEDWMERAPVAVPAEHRAALEAMVAGAKAPPEPPSAPTGVRAALRRGPAVPLSGSYELATREAIDALWNGHEILLQSCRATITPVETAPRLEPGEIGEVTVRVRNDSGFAWPGGLDREPLVRAGHHWFDADGEVAPGETTRTGFPSAVQPGETVLVRVGVVAPTEPGDYELEVDLILEYVIWFQAPLRVPVTVAPRVRPAR